MKTVQRTLTLLMCATVLATIPACNWYKKKEDKGMHKVSKKMKNDGVKKERKGY